MEKLTISELPDQILYHIIYFLPIEVVFQTCCLLSHRWKSLCYTLPCIDLRTILMDRWNRICDVPYTELLNFVDKYLLMRQSNEKISIDSFKVNLPSYDSQLCLHMNTWFETLSRCNIREIFFSISFLNRSRKYSFPKEILSSESLTVLHLRGCKFELVREYAIEINLVSLEQLSLSYVVLSDGLLKRLINSCASLIYLSLDHCEGFSSLKVEGLLGLRKLSLILNRNLERVEIDEPSLLVLKYNGGYIKHDDIKFSNCVNLTVLSLTESGITGDQLGEQLLPLENLMFLYIISCSEITYLNISKIHLEKLYLEHDEKLSVANIIAPKLQLLFLVSRYVSPSSKLLLLRLNAPRTLEVKYYLYTPVLGATMFIDLLKFLQSFHGSQLTFTTSIPNLTIPQGWRDQFSHMRSVAKFQKFWADPEAQLFGILCSIDRITVNSRKGSKVKILEDEPIEVNDGEEPI